jgi:hypothetical protein
MKSTPASGSILKMKLFTVCLQQVGVFVFCNLSSDKRKGPFACIETQPRGHKKCSFAHGIEEETRN